MTHLGGVRLRYSSILLLTALATGCGSSSTTVLTPAGPSALRCAVTLKVSTSSIASAGGSGTISIATERECQWTVKAGSDWLTFSVPPTGQGAADLAFSVQPNRSTSPRSVEVSVGDQRATISQEAAACPWNVSPTEVVMGAAGGDQTIRLSTEDFCSWVVTSRESWVAVASDSNGKGSADIILRLARNDGPERTANIDVPGGTVIVRQREGTSPVVPPPPIVNPPTPPPPTPPPPDPCIFQVTPTAFNDVLFSGSPLQVDVSTQAGCTWSAASNAPWVTLSSGTNGIGSGRVQLSVAENTGAARSGTLVIAGQTVTVNQQKRPDPCTFQVAPTAFNDVPFSGSSLQVDVSTQTGCTWTAASNATWVTISSGTNEIGSGRVQLSVAENTGAARSGTLVIAGQTVTVNQQSRPQCAYTISPSSYNPSSTGGTVSVAVTTTEGCEWSVTGNPAWASASPTSRTGSGTTTVTVQTNDGAARAATFKIAGRDFVVQQAAAPCTYTHGPTSRTIPASPTTTREIGINTQAHCPVSATESVSWIEILSAPTFGSGEIVIRIYENTGDARSATVTVTGENFVHTVTINQEARN